jgi:hypothetical protein
MYEVTYRQFKKMLGQLDKWLEMAKSHAESKGVDSKAYLDMRLAPDQFPLLRQVQVACDTAKLSISRLTGKEAPVAADNEQSIDDLRARIRQTISYLDGFNANDFIGAESRRVSQPRWEGKVMTGADYFLEHALPNFFFHLTHTYAILRHAGVPLGKRDYLGNLSLRSPS